MNPQIIMLMAITIKIATVISDISILLNLPQLSLSLCVVILAYRG